MTYTIDINKRVTFQRVRLLVRTHYEVENLYGAGMKTLYRHLFKGPEGLLVYTGEKLQLDFNEIVSIRGTVKRYEQICGTKYCRIKRAKIIRDLSHFDIDRQPALI